METLTVSLRDVRKRRTGKDRRFDLVVPVFDLGPGERVAITGPSGCGKSSFIDLLALAAAPDAAGRFTLTGRGSTHPIGDIWEHERSELSAIRAGLLGYVLQTGGLLPFLSVRENIVLPLRIAGRTDDGDLDELVSELALGDLLAEQPGRLSVGQRQRVAIARALVHRPVLVLADEPTASLDPDNAEAVMALMIASAIRHGTTIVVATHDRMAARRHGLASAPARMTAEANGLTTEFRHERPPASGPAGPAPAAVP